MDALTLQLEEKFRHDIGGLALRLLTLGTIITAIFAGLLVALSMAHIGNPFLWLWSGAIVLIAAVQGAAVLLLNREAGREGIDANISGKVDRLSLVSGVCDGVIWASASWIFLSNHFADKHLILALTVGAAATYAVVYLFQTRAAIIAACLTVVPSLILSHIYADIALWQLVLFGAVFFTAIGYGAFELRQLIFKNLRQTFEHEQQAKREVEANFIFTQHWRNTPLAAIEWDRRFRICSWNPSAESIFGYRAEEALGQPLNLIFSDDDVEKVKRKWRTLWRSHKGLRTIHVCTNKDGEPVHCEWHDSALTRDDEAIGIASFVEDVTSQVKAEEIIKNQANYDALTGLPNRRQMMNEINRAIVRSRETSEFAALVFLDLDHFKDINDTQGHDVGDIVLKEFAKKVRSLLRHEDMVARFGGDEFVVLLERLGPTRKEATDNVKAVTDKLLGAGVGLCRIGGIDYDLDLSGGVVLFDGNWGTANELLKNADLAMYRVKQGGRKGICFYDDSLSIEAEYRVELVRGLRHGLENEEFDIHFQPIVDARGKTCFSEGLLRWIRGNNNVVPAGHFIEIMSNSPMMTAVGYWSFDRVCRNINSLRDQGLWKDDAAFFVNVSPKQLTDGMFASRFLGILEANGIDPRWIVMEITEDSLIHNYDEVMDQLKELIDAGIRIALDDFGTGYSSLAMLKDLPVHYLKLDKEFIRTLLENKNNNRIVQAIIKLCEVLSLKVIAEGVEDEDQFEALRAMGCDYFQGYYFHKPMSFQDLSTTLAPGDGNRVTDIRQYEPLRVVT